MGGIPSYVAIDPSLPRGNVLRKLPEIVDFYTSIYGPYPFDAVGAIVDDAKVVGYSLETQTKPVFDRMPNEATVAHELAHMWYGDSVTLTTWPDIWLHEGFATWSEWIWSEYQGNKSAAQWFKELYNKPPQDTGFWTPPPGAPGTPAFMFNGTIYYRGGTHPAGPAGEGRRLRLLQDHAHLGAAEPVRQRDDGAVRRPGREHHRPRPGRVLRRLALPAGEADELVSETKRWDMVVKPGL